MLKKININSKKQILIVYAVLTIITLAVFWQVTQHELSYKGEYVTERPYVQSGISLDGIRWAFTDTEAKFWQPLTWLSLMLDYQIYGLNAFGYNLTNIILHILTTLLLFSLFNRMTGEIWKSAFIAALFALHPLRLELFISMHRRKDLLCAFFWMLTLCLYVYYTEKPVIKRYLLVLFSFICALMSKPMAVTLPIIMILLDYWPLERFRKHKVNLIFWQFKEKSLFFIVSAVFSFIAIYAHDPTITAYCPLDVKIARTIAAYFIHLQFFFFWIFNNEPLFEQLSFQQVLGPFLLILLISVVVIITAKRLPYLLVGWLWFIIILLPVMGIIQCGHTQLILPHHAYLSSIGIIIMLVWSISLMFSKNNFQRIILFVLSIGFLFILSTITMQMSSYCKNKTTLLGNLFFQVTNDSYVRHNNLDFTLLPTGEQSYYLNLLTHAIRFELVFPNERKLKDAINYYNNIICIKPDGAVSYNNRGTIYDKLGQHQLANEDYNHAITLKPDYSTAYINRALSCYKQDFQSKSCSLDQFSRDIEKACSLGDCRLSKFAKAVDARKRIDNTHTFSNTWSDYSKRAIDFFNKFMSSKSDNAQKYNDRGIESSKHGQYKIAIDDFNQAIHLKPDYADAYENRGLTYSKKGLYKLAIDDFNHAILLRPDFAYYYINRGAIYFVIQKKEAGCVDARKACSLGNCELLEMAKANGYCR
jgi:protein O-mannosyl-transferase